MVRAFRALRRSTDGAVAPTVALSLIGLIAAAGLAFDYARMATLDTELQTAADQAALAAATQLDGGTGARSRATAAANDLLRNITLFADAQGAPSGDERKIAVPTVAFYQSYDAVTDTPGSVASDDAGAKVVIVTVGARRASFAFTPIVGALNSGNLSAQAVASLSSSVCKIPPLMVCAPGSNFPQASDVGKGVLLEAGGGGAWVPGNYGYLEASGGSGANAIRDAIGRNGDAEACVSNDPGVDTQTGNMANVPTWLNTRFDVYDRNNVPGCSANGDFCPAQNVRKDMARTEEVVVETARDAAQPENPGCGAPGATVKDDFVHDLATTGFPRDANQVACTTNDNSCPKFGTGEWARATYANDVHGTTPLAIANAMGKTVATLTRWDVYRWELANPPTRMTPSSVLNVVPVDPKTQGQTTKWKFTNKCAYPSPKNGTAVVPSATQKDRRLLTVAIVDCTGQNGRFNAHILRFADMFLIQPSVPRRNAAGDMVTGGDQVYVEIVRVAEKPNGQSAFQYYLRQRPRLIK